MPPEIPDDILVKSRDLEDGLRTGRYDGRFILDTMRSGEWYGAYVALAGRLEDPGVIESLVRDMLKHLGSAREPASDALCCGVDLTGTDVLALLARRGMPRKELLTIDIETIARSETPECCRELTIETTGMLLFSSDDKGRSPCLSWGGVHHGSSGYHCLSTLGNLASLAQEFRGRERIAIIAHCGDYREQGMVPPLIALAKALGVPPFVYTSLPIKLAIAPRFHARAKEALEKWKKLTQATVLDPETVMNDQNFRTMSLKEFFVYTEQWMAEKIFEDFMGKPWGNTL